MLTSSGSTTTYSFLGTRSSPSCLEDKWQKFRRTVLAFGAPRPWNLQVSFSPKTLIVQLLASWLPAVQREFYLFLFPVSILFCRFLGPSLG